MLSQLYHERYQIQFQLEVRGEMAPNIPLKVFPQEFSIFPRWCVLAMAVRSVGRSLMIPKWNIIGNHSHEILIARLTWSLTPPNSGAVLYAGPRGGRGCPWRSVVSFRFCEQDRDWNVKSQFFSSLSPLRRARSEDPPEELRGSIRERCDDPHARTINKNFGISRVSPRTSDSETWLPIFEYLSYLPVPSVDTLRNAHHVEQ